jgi:hypothetical protein
MKIRFDASDIKEIVLAYVKSQFPPIADKPMTVGEVGGYSWERGLEVCVTEPEPQIELKEAA